MIFSRDNLVIYELVDQPLIKLEPVKFNSGQSAIETINFARSKNLVSVSKSAMTKGNGQLELSNFVFVQMAHQNGQAIVMIVAEPTV